MSIKDPREWTAAETETVILNALEARDFETVVAGLKLMVTKDARRASDLYDAMLLGIALAERGVKSLADVTLEDLLTSS